MSHDSPALAAWHRRGDLARRDALWLAAAEEAAAGELERVGLLAGAERARAKAGDLVAAAVECRDPACSHLGSSCLRWRDLRREQRRKPGEAAT